MPLFFAETELYHSGSRADAEYLIAVYSKTIARRVSLWHRTGIGKKKLTFSGGVAKYTGVKKALEDAIVWILCS
jgi:activator of 2-hydroxyglutaryl-CoA dehydratase